jgi:hypothetical protein
MYPNSYHLHQITVPHYLICIVEPSLLSNHLTTKAFTREGYNWIFAPEKAKMQVVFNGSESIVGMLPTGKESGEYSLNW